MAVNKIAVTGTKGKTTVVNVFAELLRKLGVKTVLHVNTDGHYINGVQKSTTKDSIHTWGMRPTVGPGRYLFEFLHSEQVYEECAAVMEASLSSGTTIGTGYPVVSVATFLNVFEDHIGSSVRTKIRSRSDLAKLKSFIYTRMKNGSYAVCNADDRLVVRSLKALPKEKKVNVVYFGLRQKPTPFLRRAHTAGFVTVEDGVVVYITKEKTLPIMPIDTVPWTFKGLYEPSIYNVLAIVSMALGYYGEDLPGTFADTFASIHLDPRSGRLVQFSSQRDVTLIADYAHESESLREIARMAKRMTKKGGRVIGLVRLAHNRSDAHIKKVAKTIAEEYDELFVYDKIDGHFTIPDPEKQTNKKFPKVIGRTSTILHEAILKYGGVSERIVREDQAIAAAADKARAGDVVIAIVGDDIERSIECLKQSFDAEVLG